MDGGVASHSGALGDGSVPAATRAAAGVGDGQDDHYYYGEHDRSRDPGPPAWLEKRVHEITSFMGRYLRVAEVVQLAD
jgi:hypothetical protein